MVLKAVHNGMLQINKKMEINMALNLLRYVYKLNEKIHYISNIWVSNHQINDLLNSLMISQNIFKKKRRRIKKKLMVNWGNWGTWGL